MKTYLYDVCFKIEVTEFLVSRRVYFDVQCNKCMDIIFSAIVVDSMTDDLLHGIRKSVVVDEVKAHKCLPEKEVQDEDFFTRLGEAGFAVPA